jgi:hypothetical protein
MTTINSTLSTTLAELQDLLTWPENWNSYGALAPNPDAVSHATKWITEVYQHLTSQKQQWIAPNVTANADGDVLLSWRRGQRDLEVYVEQQSMFYIIIDGKGTDAKLTDGDIKTIEDMQHLWQWLLEAGKEQEA